MSAETEAVLTVLNDADEPLSVGEIAAAAWMPSARVAVVVGGLVADGLADQVGSTLLGAPTVRLRERGAVAS